MATKTLQFFFILFFSSAVFANDDCLNKALSALEKPEIKLPPGADDYFRKRMQASMGVDPSMEQVDALVRANKKFKVNKSADGEQVLRDSGLFTDEQIKKIVQSKGLDSPDLAAAAGNITVGAREVAAATPVKTPPPATSQSAAPRTDTPSAQLADAMDTGQNIQAAYKQSQAEVKQIISKTNGNNLSVDQLADFSTRGLSPAEAANYMKSAVSSDAEFAKAMATLDKKVQVLSSKAGAQADYSAAQIQEVKVQLMNNYYEQKFKVKPGADLRDYIDDASLETLQAAEEKMLALKKKKSKYWPSGS